MATNPYLVNTSTGYVPKEGAKAIPCNAIVELEPSAGDPLVAKGYLLAEDSKGMDDEQKAAFAAYRMSKADEAKATADEAKASAKAEKPKRGQASEFSGEEPPVASV